jgi:hypothetical protein
MLINGEMQKEVIRPKFNRAIMIGPKNLFWIAVAKAAA